MENREDGFGFGGAGIWLFAILALMWGGNGFFGGNRGIDGRVATVEDVNTTTNFARLEGQVRANENLIQNGISALGNGISDLGYKILGDFGALSQQLATCCCGINQNILENRYISAQNTASINANTTAQVQKVLDAICQNKIEAQAQRINQLELQSALCGVVRYPTTTTFTAPHPFGFGCNGF